MESMILPVFTGSPRCPLSFLTIDGLSKYLIIVVCGISHKHTTAYPLCELCTYAKLVYAQCVSKCCTHSMWNCRSSVCQSSIWCTCLFTGCFPLFKWFHNDIYCHDFTLGSRNMHNVLFHKGITFELFFCTLKPKHLKVQLP